MDDDDLGVPVWEAPPVGVLPGVAPTAVIMGRNPETLVALTCLRCYPDGVEMLLTVRTRHRADALDRAVNIDNPGRLDWSVRHADGSVARPDYLSVGRPPGPTIVPLAGYGTDTTLDLGFWLWPLPAEGPLTVECAWPDRDLSMVTTTVDVGPLREAASRAVAAWRE
ncbi:hypothetical protein [Georgenia sp. SUBG003]|uniref:hypothetical protein n=1 Tax=Georgenia sp. SUBG003 TaxID=1497974 RepID=UPI0004D930D1|nr:hypothetical protein DA06_11820 [Georgenia sp. SUBG003]